MSLKKKKDNIVELSDNWIAVPSKTHSNKIYYFNTVTKKSTWENPCKSNQKNETAPAHPQAGSSGGKSRKRKAEDKKVAEESFRNESQKGTDHPSKSIAGSDRNKIIAYDILKSKGDSSSRKLIECIPTKLQITNKKSSCDDNLRNVKNHTPSTSTQMTASVNTEGDEDFPSLYRLSSTSKRSEKTSAQNRLLRKRKEFRAMAIKMLTSPSISSKLPIMKSQLERENDSLVKKKNLDSRIMSINKNNVQCKDTEWLMKRIKSDEKFQRNLDALSEDSKIVSKAAVEEKSICPEDEEMDWETSEQEVMIEHIKSIRKNLSNVTELSTDIAVFSNEMSVDESGSTKLVLVFDTNVFISCLPFIKDVRDKFILDFGLPTIFIPWRVLQELDHLKASSNKQLSVSAMRAIRYINDNFTARHPRIKGQSFEEFSSLTKQECLSPDDEILRICLNIVKGDESNVVILITNDKNLETKAIVSNVQAYSKDRFVAEKINHSKKSVSDIVSPKRLTSDSDITYCKLKDLLQKSLGQLLETELIDAFGKDWKRLVIRKPPWTAMDIIECLIKHWRSVFSFVFQKNILPLIEELKQHLSEMDKGSKEAVHESIQVTKELLASMKTMISDEKHYRQLLEKGISEADALQSDETHNQGKTDENQVHHSTLLTSEICSSNETCRYAAESPAFDPQDCRAKVKNVFQMIWDRVKTLSWRISEAVTTKGIGNPDAINEIKYQFPIAIRTIQELVEIVEKILSMQPERLNERDQLIMHFSGYLVSLNIFQIDAAELNRLPMYIGFFCGDSEGRVILSTFINDLKQFGMEMMNGMKTLGFV
ncbi:UNVERIFIED_CONTAM: hypothetical protein PYX00_001606 [Menopon gallinae]|uniref:WW domain-containing protein n=1 Tax=Menopon gallinae TaxID=328185 RepID=A0AAW2IDZ7_9NEOP